MKNGLFINDRNKFIKHYGLMRFGLPGGITMAFLYQLLNVNFDLNLFEIRKVFSTLSLIFILLFLIGGYIWGYLMWLLIKKKCKISRDKCS